MAVTKRWHIAFSSTEASAPVNLSVPKKVGIFLVSGTVILILFLILSFVYVIHNGSKPRFA